MLKISGSLTKSMGKDWLLEAMESMENCNSRRFPTDPTASTAIIESELKKHKALSINKPFIISQLRHIWLSMHPQILLTRQIF